MVRKTQSQVQEVAGHRVSSVRKHRSMLAFSFSCCPSGTATCMLGQLHQKTVQLILSGNTLTLSPSSVSTWRLHIWSSVQLRMTMIASKKKLLDHVMAQCLALAGNARQSPQPLPLHTTANNITRA